MRIAIIGGGIGGLYSGYFLSKKGFKVTIFEKDKELGGLLGSYKIGKTHLEKYYHHFFNTDNKLIELIKELGLTDKIIKKRTDVGFAYKNRLIKCSTPLDLMKFNCLGLIDRLRLGLSVLRLKYMKNGSKIDKISAKEWLTKNAGYRSYKAIWEPLLKIKFGDDYQNISAAWVWGRISTRLNSRKRIKEELFYLKGGFKTLVDKLSKRIKDNKGNIINEKVNSIEKDKKKFIINNNHKFDKIVLTVPSKQITNMYKWPNDFIESLNKIKYKSVVCMTLELKEPLSDIYWTNVLDDNNPLSIIIEHTNMINKKSYGSNIVYLANYISQDSSLMKMKNYDLLKHYCKGLRNIYPKFSENIIKNYYVTKNNFGTPIYDKNYFEKILPLNTPIKGIYVVNTSQIFPFDRSINFSIKMAKKYSSTIVKYIEKDNLEINKE